MAAANLLRPDGELIFAIIFLSYLLLRVNGGFSSNTWFFKPFFKE